MNRLLAVPLVALALAGCTRRETHVVVQPAEPRPVSIEVEVYDPVTGFVWQDVGVRIVEADQEWSGCTCVNPYPDDWFFSDSNGLVFFDEFLLADSEVGFMEDSTGAALLGPGKHEDEAVVVLELDALGFQPVFVDVHLSWDEPDVFVSVPFE